MIFLKQKISYYTSFSLSIWFETIIIIILAYYDKSRRLMTHIGTAFQKERDFFHSINFHLASKNIGI